MGMVFQNVRNSRCSYFTLPRLKYIDFPRAALAFGQTAIEAGNYKNDITGTRLVAYKQTANKQGNSVLVTEGLEEVM